MSQPLAKKIFSSHPGPLVPYPDLVAVQFDSFRWFQEVGLKELLEEISPIRDHAGREFELHFKRCIFDEPKFSAEVAKDRSLTYDAPLRMEVELVNLVTGKRMAQELYFGDFPIMTSKGTFIMSGVERVVISQLVRSPGVYFTANYIRGERFFGSKIIPNRGAWIEIESEPGGFVGMKIDRRRKVPVTAFLRAMGLETKEAMLAAFTNPLARKLIEATLKDDPSSTVGESYLEIYRRLRPGDLVTAQGAQSLIEGMFKRADRYDLSEVGRYKANQTLGTPEETSRLVTLRDLVRIIEEIAARNVDPRAIINDIDHLGNRRLRAVGELLQARMRLGFSRVRRIVQDRMSTIERSALTPAQLINVRPLIGAVRDFFATSSMSQFMDQINPLCELEHMRRVSALGPGGLTRDRAGLEVRDVHHSHYGRLCPIQTPEGSSIGLINYLSLFTRPNKFGFLETPYIRVKKGVVTDEVVWLDAVEEESLRITHSGETFDPKTRLLVNPVVEARFGEKLVKVPREEADLIDVAPSAALSAGAALIPFLENTDGKRSLMGSNMQKQAVPSVKPDIPLVGTGIEEKVALDSGHVVVAREAGEVVEVDASHITVATAAGERKRHVLEKFRMTNQAMAFSSRPTVRKGERVHKGQVIADGPAIKNGHLALGQNLLVAFLSWEGVNFEDAIVVSERIVHDDRYTSVHIEEFTCDVRDTKLGPELTTPDIPNVSEEKLRNLDAEGIVRIGAEVGSGDILVGRISPRGETELTPEERLLRAIFGEKSRDVKDTSKEVPHGKGGRVIGVKIFDREKGDKLEPGVIRRIHVQIASLRNLKAGDKMAGRYGNKGVIAQIRPVEDMPYLEDGTPVDIVLNPLGVVSRMNLGQIFETHLGWAASKLGYHAITPALSGVTEEQIYEELVRAGLPPSGQVPLYDGRTGERFDRPVTVGRVYMLKLNHMVLDKLHMRSTGPYSLITQQPLGGKAQFGGQRFGEMEVWALEGYGAAHTLQEMLTIKSDDVMGRTAAYEAIVRGEPIRQPNVPATFNVMVNELKALGIGVELVDGEAKEGEGP